MIILAIALAGSAAFVAAGTADEQSIKPIGQLIWEEHARSANHPQRLPLPPADPVLAAREALTVETHGGRTVAQWLDAASPDRLLALRGEPAPADLTAEVMRLSEIVGANNDLVTVQLRADAVPADLRAPFASLVSSVADAYAGQKPLAGLDTLNDAQRDASFARAEAIVTAMNDFRFAIAGIDVPVAATPIFSDPAGIVILGGAGDDTWTKGGQFGDPVLQVDIGGNDVYTNNAGGACAAPIYHVCNMLVVSVALDLDGNDIYTYDGEPNAVQGAASVGGIGIVLDVQGNDQYLSRMVRTNSGPFNFPLGYTDGGAQGMSNAGVGLQIDGLGDDTYRATVGSTQGRAIWNFAQGWGGNGGIGISADASGDDLWLAYGEKMTRAGGVDCTRNTCSFIGVYTNGVGFFGGIGIQVDAGLGNDVYQAYQESATVDYYAQGFGAFGGVGILFEDGGDDTYSAVQQAFDPFIVPLLNCAFGTGSLGGFGIFLEMGGNDIYYGDSISPTRAYTMNEGFGGIGAGYGLFVDMSGDDGHFMYAHGAAGSNTFGRGVLIENGNPLSIDTNGNGGANRAGNYLDLGGSDTYVGAAPSSDGARWSGGADLNLAPSLALQLVLG